jgi:hypothetical protein
LEIQVDITQSNLLQSLKEVQKFLDEHGPRLGVVNQTGARKKLDDAVVEITQIAAVQAGAGMAARSATRTLLGLTASLVNHHMKPIARIAAAELPPVPELAPLSLPKENQTGERLVALARGMAAEAAKYESTFVHAGLPLDFIKQLDAAADALAAAVGYRKQRLGERGGATEMLDVQLKAARKVVKVLDAFVKTAGKDDVSLLASWKIVKRLRQPSTKAPAATAIPAAPASGGAA